MLRLCSAHTDTGVQLHGPHLARSACRDCHIKGLDARLQLRRAHLLECRQCPLPLQHVQQQVGFAPAHMLMTTAGDIGSNDDIFILLLR